MKAILVFFICFTLIFPTSFALADGGYSSNYLKQRENYTKAAAAADKAAEANQTMSMIWGGVGVVCLAVCCASMAGTAIFTAGTDNLICMGASMGGSIADMVITKKVESAILGIVGPATSLATGAGGAGNAAAAAYDQAVINEERAANQVENLSSTVNEAQQQVTQLQGQVDQTTATLAGYRTRFETIAATPADVQGRSYFQSQLGQQQQQLTTAQQDAKNLSTQLDQAKSVSAQKTQEAYKAQDAAKQGNSKNWGACLSAAMAIVQAIMKNQSSEQEKGTAQDNRAQTAQLDTYEQQYQMANAQHNKRRPTNPKPSEPDFNAPSTNPTSATAKNLGSFKSSETSAATASTSPALLCDLSGDHSASLLECAQKLDATLPSSLTSELFARGFYKISHQSFQDFLKKSYSSPAEAISDGLKAYLKPKQTIQLVSLLNDVTRTYQNNSAPLARNISSQLNTPEKIPEIVTSHNPTTHHQTSSFTNRTPDLFDRVSNRYESVYRRMLLSK